MLEHDYVIMSNLREFESRPPLLSRRRIRFTAKHEVSGRTRTKGGGGLAIFIPVDLPSSMGGNGVICSDQGTPRSIRMGLFRVSPVFTGDVRS